MACANIELSGPGPANRYSFRPSDFDADYLAWPKTVELCNESISRSQEMRKGALMAVERTVLEKRMRAYYDSRIGWDELKILEARLFRRWRRVPGSILQDEGSEG